MLAPLINISNHFMVELAIGEISVEVITIITKAFL